jgi:hypothetical protein
LIRRILTALHAALGRWLAASQQPVKRQRYCSFDCDVDTLREVFGPREDDDTVAWYRSHFRNWPRSR